LFVLRTVLPVLVQASLQLQVDAVSFSEADAVIDVTKSRLIAIVEEKTVCDNLRAEWTRFESVVGPLTDAAEQYATKLSTDYASALVGSLTDRFPPSPLVRCFRVFSPLEYPTAFTSTIDFGIAEIGTLVSHFKPVLPETPLSPMDQWMLFRQLMKHNYQGATTPKELCSSILTRKNVHETYPTMIALAKIALTLSFSTACAERGFSTMDRIKTEFRNRLREDNLNSLLMISANGPPLLSERDMPEISKRWREAKVRRGGLGRDPDESLFEYPFPVEPLDPLQKH
jgi:hypothetical protein